MFLPIRDFHELGQGRVQVGYTGPPSLLNTRPLPGRVALTPPKRQYIL